MGTTTPSDFVASLDLTERSRDTFAGWSAGFPFDPLKRVYGGHIVAQALRAAVLTVPAHLRVSALHASYVRRGDVTQPLIHRVDRVHTGRSFAHRSVIVSQLPGVIALLVAQFQHVEEATSLKPIQLGDMPAVPPPTALRPGGWSDTFDRRYAPIDDRIGRVQAWLRMNDPIPEVAGLDACALAYLADDVPGDAALRLIAPDQAPANEPHEIDWSWWTQSLDHAVWFHAPLRANHWHLEDLAATRLARERVHVHGRIFDQDGTHVATVSQDVLVRPAREGWAGADGGAATHQGRKDGG